VDQKYIEFGRLFESRFLTQRVNEARTINESLDLGWKLLSTLPRGELDRVDDALLDEHYHPEKEKKADPSEQLLAAEQLVKDAQTSPSEEEESK